MLRFFPVGQYEEKMLAKNVAPPLIYFLFSTIIFAIFMPKNGLD